MTAVAARGINLADLVDPGVRLIGLRVLAVQRTVCVLSCRGLGAVVLGVLPCCRHIQSSTIVSGVSFFSIKKLLLLCNFDRDDPAAVPLALTLGSRDAILAGVHALCTPYA
ncbi:unnamed protein product [Ectocarpus fasciculatus]